MWVCCRKDDTQPGSEAVVQALTISDNQSDAALMEQVANDQNMMPDENVVPIVPEPVFEPIDSAMKPVDAPSTAPGVNDATREAGKSQSPDRERYTAFTVTISRQKEDPMNLGLLLDPCDKKTLFVSSIAEGAVMNYNRKSPQPHVEVHDIITEVNGVSDDAQAMLKVLKRAEAAEDITIRVVRPQKSELDIKKLNGKIGLCLSWKTKSGVALYIDEVKEAGPFAGMTGENQVTAGDRILSVNGIAGSAQTMYDEIARYDTLSLVLLQVR
mmetsp:Transcript_81912/g.228295  ORF Transcript_81912/g.228295 Transcript_81912/m.228295 type:complete len:270 (-) Transcript_81912:152-961(-)